MHALVKIPIALTVLLVSPLGAASQAESVVDWGQLPNLVKQLPAPPDNVAQTQRYRREIEPRLDAMEQAIEYYERHLEQVTERLNDLTEREVHQTFSETERQGRAAADRLARREQTASAPDHGRSQQEETAMRETLPGGNLPQVTTGQLSQATLSFALQAANLQRREEQAANRLAEEWQTADAGCNDDERCAKTEEFRHLGKMTKLKNGTLTGIRTPWERLRTAGVALGDQTKAAIELLKEGGNWLNQTSGNAAKNAMNRIKQLEPIRVLLGALSLLYGSTRQQWDESNNLREQMENLGPQSAAGRTGTQ